MTPTFANRDRTAKIFAVIVVDAQGMSQTDSMAHTRNLAEARAGLLRNEAYGGKQDVLVRVVAYRWDFRQQVYLQMAEERG